MHMQNMRCVFDGAAHIVRNHEDGDTVVFVQGSDQFVKLVGNGRIKAGNGFVQYE